MKERITILGKATPVFDEYLKEGLICTTGINESGEFRRLYPVPITNYEQFSNWNIVNIELLEQGAKCPFSDHRDYRPESRILDLKAKEPFEVLGQVTGIRNRFNIIKDLLNQSEAWIKAQREPRRTIGIIRPKDLKVTIEISKQKPKESKDPEFASLLEYTNPEIKKDATKRRFIEKKLRQYLTRILDIRFNFKCHYNPECRGHTKLVLDDGLHQYTRKLNRELPVNDVILKTRENIELRHSRSWIFLGIGTVTPYPYKSYTIGSVFTFPKSKISEHEISEIFSKKQLKINNAF
ncbi:hypothetical protein LCGC14_0928060 [marine sediment metagenome]|uniref:Uncharacterized protein n=1 Tax=marine sediment metagenome TaxID=412755 RepID=A0A0F9NNX4_9ZZZZ